MPRYTIFLPVFNGLPYLETSLRSALEIQSDSLEILASDDGSTDGSREFLHSITDPRFRILPSVSHSSMSEHWEYMLQFGSGDWQMFLGQDDALQSNFFHLAERVTMYAEANEIRAISSRRAYHFWPGTEHQAEGSKIRYIGYVSERIVDSAKAVGKVLGGKSTYFDLPHMYTSSLVHKTLLEDARVKQNGAIILGHPQDAFLAATICSMESRFLRSEVPLGWVGTSTKSAGFAVSANSVSVSETEAAHSLRSVYLSKISQSGLEKESPGDIFTIDLNPVYFWHALNKVDRIIRPPHRPHKSSLYALMLGCARAEISKPGGSLSPDRRQSLDNLFRSWKASPEIYRALSLYAAIERRLWRVFVDSAKSRVFRKMQSSGLSRMFGLQIKNDDSRGFQWAQREVSQKFSATLPPPA